MRSEMACGDLRMSHRICFMIFMVSTGSKLEAFEEKTGRERGKGREEGEKREENGREEGENRGKERKREINGVGEMKVEKRNGRKPEVRG